MPARDADPVTRSLEVSSRCGARAPCLGRGDPSSLHLHCAASLRNRAPTSRQLAVKRSTVRSYSAPPPCRERRRPALFRMPCIGMVPIVRGSASSPGIPQSLAPGGPREPLDGSPFVRRGRARQFFAWARARTYGRPAGGSGTDRGNRLRELAASVEGFGRGAPSTGSAPTGTGVISDLPLGGGSGPFPCGQSEMIPS